MKVEKHESLSEEGKKYGIWLTPTIIINEKVLAAGRGVSQKDIEKMVLKLMKEQSE